ncbi:MAG TPA: alpha/beta hydrolase [Candidatus Acidoferrales bacterium]|nr:alpha/beta hydrolase [Candidatus Acidoferrales bacterium]
MGYHSHVPQAEELVMLPSGGTLRVEGPDTDPILFLHGAAGGAWSWSPQRAAFATKRRICTWEARGHGTAARVEDAGLRELYVDARQGLAAVIDLVRRPALVVGHSVGALLAMALACDVGAAVRALFLIDPLYVTVDGRGLVKDSIVPFARAFAAPLLRSYRTNGFVSRRFTRWAFERMFVDRERMEAAWRYQCLQIPLEYPRLLREALGARSGFPIRDYAAEIAEPTYIVEAVHGVRRPVDPKLVETLRRRLGPNFHHETVDGGHYLQLDRPDEVNEHLGRFLEAYGG